MGWADNTHAAAARAGLVVASVCKQVQQSCLPRQLFCPPTLTNPVAGTVQVQERYTQSLMLQPHDDANVLVTMLLQPSHLTSRARSVCGSGTAWGWP